MMCSPIDAATSVDTNTRWRTPLPSECLQAPCTPASQFVASDSTPLVDTYFPEVEEATPKLDSFQAEGSLSISSDSLQSATCSSSERYSVECTPLQPNKLRLRHRHRVRPLRRSSQPDMKRFFPFLWVLATKRPVQPPRVFLRRPSVPPRDHYLQRVWMNLFFFTRNYFQLVAGLTLLCCIMYPMLFALWALALATHVRLGYHIRFVSSLLRILQLAACCSALYVLGVCRALTVVAMIGVPVMAHALLTASDEAYAAGKDFLESNGCVVRLPGSPTHALEAVDETFADALSMSRTSSVDDTIPQLAASPLLKRMN